MAIQMPSLQVRCQHRRGSIGEPASPWMRRGADIRVYASLRMHWTRRGVLLGFLRLRVALRLSHFGDVLLKFFIKVRGRGLHLMGTRPQREDDHIPRSGCRGHRVSYGVAEGAPACGRPYPSPAVAEGTAESMGLQRAPRRVDDHIPRLRLQRAPCRFSFVRRVDDHIPRLRLQRAPFRFSFLRSCGFPEAVEGETPKLPRPPAG